MTPPDELPLASLSAAGLNLVAVFNLDALPPPLKDVLAQENQTLDVFRQLILIAHGGTAFWQALTHHGRQGSDPVDMYTRQQVSATMNAVLGGRRYQVLYPGNTRVGLQRLGELAGWHHPSPFGVGVNSRWGSWFAYRALILADSCFSETTRWAEPSPCVSCESQACVAACPASAMENGAFLLERCLQYRRREDSLCHHQCLARNACPVARMHRYNDEQMAHHYGVSLRFIQSLP